MSAFKDFVFRFLSLLIILVLGFSYIYFFTDEGDYDDLNQKIEEYQLQIDKLKDIDYNYDGQEDVLSVLNLLVESNSTVYYIRNEILYNNDGINRDRANYKAALIYSYASKYGVHPYLMVAIGIQESRLKHLSVSNMGAVGIFQLMPIIERKYGVDANILEENIEGGTRFIRDLLDMYEDYPNDYNYSTLELALAHYNGGSRPIKALREYPETRDYVPVVVNNFENMKKKY